MIVSGCLPKKMNRPKPDVVTEVNDTVKDIEPENKEDSVIVPDERIRIEPMYGVRRNVY